MCGAALQVIQSDSRGLETEETINIAIVTDLQASFQFKFSAETWILNTNKNIASFDAHPGCSDT